MQTVLVTTYQHETHHLQMHCILTFWSQELLWEVAREGKGYWRERVLVCRQSIIVTGQARGRKVGLKERRVLHWWSVGWVCFGRTERGGRVGDEEEGQTRGENLVPFLHLHNFGTIAFSEGSYQPISLSPMPNSYQK